MTGPAKNRLHDYEAGWLSMLLEMGVAEERDLRSVMNRVAHQAIADMEARREQRLVEKKSRRRRSTE